MRFTFERRLRQPRWLSLAVPVASVVFAFFVAGIVLLATGHNPLSTYRQLFDAAFLQTGSLNQTLIVATPLAFTGLAAAAAFRMKLFNIGAEGQMYIGSITGAAAGLYLGGRGGSSVFVIAAMVVMGGLGGTAWALIPGILRAFCKTNEILTSLLLNYVAGLLLTYLIFQSQSYWRETKGFNATVFPTGKELPPSAVWPSWTLDVQGGITIPLGAVIAVIVAIVLWVLYKRTRFGFEAQVLGDSDRAARYSGVRVRRKILAVMALSGGIAGLAGASQVGDFAHSRRRRPERPAEARLRLHGDRHRRARPLQPLRGRPRRVPDGRPRERRQHAAGRELPGGSRGRDPGDHPVLGARRRGADPPPGAHRPLESRQRRERAGARGVNNTLLVVLIASGIAYGTPLLYASLGELLAERSGVLNLGVEGMMLVGAVMGFWTVQRVHTGPGIALTAGILVAAVAGAAMASIHAFLVITFRASQIVSGLALTIFAGAVGLSSYLGNDLNLADAPARHTFHAVFPASMQRWPIIGPIVFGQDVLVYISWACVIAIWLYLSRTRPGLNVRSVGESPAAADTMGINVTAYRYAHTLVGGAFAGVAGASITLAITPQWVNGITGGAGWIAIALVIFAFWRPELCLVGAYFFGALQALAPQLQARHISLGPTVLWTNALPYVMTIVVLVVVSSGVARSRLGAPAALGNAYAREDR